MKYLVVGLGNPGMKYTRHNIGADLLGVFIKKYVKKIHHNLFCLNDNLYFLLCPDMMNISGKNVYETFQKYNCEHLIVVVDELDIDFGKIKTKYSTGANGHNGIRDIMKYFSRKIWKICVGIGRPKGNIPISKYVLDSFTLEEQNMFTKLAYIVGNELSLIIEKINNNEF